MEIEILGGLKVEIDFTIERADPEVGIMNDYVEEWYITHVKGFAYTAKRLQRLYKLIAAHKEDGYIEQRLNESF